MFWAFCASGCREATNNHMASCKSPIGRLESHQRGFWIETLLLGPGDLLSKSSKLTFSRKRWRGGGQPPVNVRKVGEKRNAVRQADSGFGGRCSRKSSEAPLRPGSPLPVRPLNLMTFATGGTLCAGSRQGEVRQGAGHPFFHFLCYIAIMWNVSIIAVQFSSVAQ